MSAPIVPGISDEQLAGIYADAVDGGQCNDVDTLLIIARLRAAEADAKRYRWLREACDNDPENLGVCYAETPGVDAAIDAALAKARSQS